MVLFSHWWSIRYAPMLIFVADWYTYFIKVHCYGLESVSHDQSHYNRITVMCHPEDLSIQPSRTKQLIIHELTHWSPTQFSIPCLTMEILLVWIVPWLQQLWYEGNSDTWYMEGRSTDLVWITNNYPHHDISMLKGLREHCIYIYLLFISSKHFWYNLYDFRFFNRKSTQGQLWVNILFLLLIIIYARYVYKITSQ